MDDEGYVNIVGRIKDMIIRGGENVYPREIEEFLYTHPDIVDVQVIGVPDERYGEEIMAWVRLRDGAAASTPTAVREFCQGRIAHYKVPRYVHVTDEFPMTVTGQDPEVQDARGCRSSCSACTTRPPSRPRETPGVTTSDAVRRAGERALEGNLHKESDKLARQGKLFVRDRLDLLLDPGTLVEDALLANALAPADDLPADGVVTGRGLIDGRPVCVMANDPTVKAGSWGARTVEKIIRLTEYALRHELPVIWLVDSAGARITDQVQLFPGRRGAGRIFYNQVRLSGRVPQVCCLFGPSAAGGAYIPSFCDVVFMVEGNASMYLGSPRMAEEVIGEKVTLEEMGGARMHTTVSGCGDNLVGSDAEAIELARLYLSYLPRCFRERAATGVPVDRADHGAERVDGAGGRAAGLRHAPPGGRLGGRRVVLRDQAALRRRADHRLRAARGQQRRHRRQQPRREGRCALRQLGRQGGPVHLAVQRVQRPPRLPRRRARAS